MKKAQIKSVTCFFVAIAVLVVGLISLTIANYRATQINDRLVKELNNSTHILTSTQAELAQVQQNLIAEQNESFNLQAQLDTANTIIDTLKSEEYVVGMTVTNREINMLAQTVWGEARGCNKLEQSAVVWCILNRVDAGDGTIAEVITAPGQFHGYDSSYPVTDEIKALVEDVVARWKLEKVCEGDVGRTLPSNYLYFRADGTGIGNIFRTTYDGDYEVWDWDCWNPYS